MITDYHSHILPGIDDGAKDTAMSLEMLEIMKAQGVERVVATPHFYAHRENGVLNFIEKRRKAYEKLTAQRLPVSSIMLGAEVAVEKDISELENIEKLAIEGTDLILLELPYRSFGDWMLEEIENIASSYKLTPIIAHVHRYQPYYSKSDYEKVLQADAVFQVNAEAFKSFRDSGFVKKLIKNEFPLVFGSDAHNTTDRKPDLGDALKKLKKYSSVLDASNAMLEKHMK